MIAVMVPFDLRLWTGVVESTDPDADVYSQFAQRRDLVKSLNALLSKSVFGNCRLRVPLTQSLFEQLATTPPWSEIEKGSLLHRLKAVVLALLRNRQGAEGLTLYVDVGETVHLHTWEQPSGFFSSSLLPMREDWVEMVGVCAFAETVSSREFAQPMPVLGTCVITAFSDASQARISRRPVINCLEGDWATEATVPLLSESDAWAWERVMRRYIWQDERLPLGPVGYIPTEDWRLGSRPRRHHNAYRDALGGLWEWEGGRATSGHSDGHWNVQLPNPSVKHQWVRWIEKCTEQEITSPPDSITHINVEPNGQIVDFTFQWCE